MSAKLDALANRVLPEDRARIEAALAKEVPLVTADEVTAFDLQHQQEWRVERGYGECRACSSTGRRDKLACRHGQSLRKSRRANGGPMC